MNLSAFGMCVKFLGKLYDEKHALAAEASRVKNKLPPRLHSVLTSLSLFFLVPILPFLAFFGFFSFIPRLNLDLWVMPKFRDFANSSSHSDLILANEIMWVSIFVPLLIFVILLLFSLIIFKIKCKSITFQVDYNAFKFSKKIIKMCTIIILIIFAITWAEFRYGKFSGIGDRDYSAVMSVIEFALWQTRYSFLLLTLTLSVCYITLFDNFNFEDK